MDLIFLKNFFETYVNDCRLNVQNLPESFIYTNVLDSSDDSVMTTIAASAEVPDLWLENAASVLRVQFPQYSTNWFRSIENHSLFVFEMRQIENDA